VALHLSYEFVVAPYYTYMKLSYTAPNIPVYATLVILAVALACLMPTRLTRPADLVVWVLYVAVVLPSMLISYLARTLPDTSQLMLGFVMTACFGGIVMAVRLPTGTLAERVVKVSPKVFWAGVIAWSVLTYGSLLASGAVRLDLPSITQVYSVRSDYASHVASARLVGYLVTPQANVINPFVIATGLYLRKYWMVVLGIFGELAIYAAAAYKTVLFAIPVLLVVAYIFRRGRRPWGVLIPGAFTAVVAISAAIDSRTATPWLTSLFVRRFIDLPGVLTGAWVSIFSAGPKMLFSYSFLSPFFTNPYPTAPAYVVGARFLNSPRESANANFFADGYANMGWPGVVFEAAVVAVVLVLANKLSHGVPLMVSSMLFVMPSVTLANASIFTSLLTHGIFLALVIVAVAPRSIWERRTDLTASRGDTTVNARDPVIGVLSTATAETGGAVGGGGHRDGPSSQLSAASVEASPPGRSGSLPIESWWQRGKLSKATVLDHRPPAESGNPSPSGNL
jgi:hypothetical protein